MWQAVRSIACAIGLMFVAASPSEASVGCPFEKNARVVFVGDSITQHGHYIRFFSEYCLKHYPGSDIQFFNAGLGGDTVASVLLRLEEDVCIHRPTDVVVMLGMNDAFGVPYDRLDTQEGLTRRNAVIADYAKRLGQLRASILTASPGVRFVWMTPSIFDETVESGWQPNNLGQAAVLSDMGREVKRLAERNGDRLIDLNAPMMAFTAYHQRENPLFTLTGRDRVHPDEAGGFWMAYEMLRQLGALRDFPERIEVDCDDGSVVTHEGGVFSFSHKDESFSMEFCAPISNVVTMVGANRTNKRLLAVKNLPSGMYKVTVDGCIAGAFSEMMLAKGVDLNTYGNLLSGRQSREISRLNGRLRAMELRQRQHVEARNYFRRQGVSPDDFEAIQAYGERMRKEGRDRTWFLKQSEPYLRDWPRRDLLMKEMMHLRDAVRACDNPRTHAYRLERMDDARAPFAIRRGDEWVDIDDMRHVEAGSAIDFSQIVEGRMVAKAGKRIVTKEGHFVLQGEDAFVRLYGANVCFTANFPTRDEADRQLDNLQRAGYNSIRLHHFEWGATEGAKDGYSLNPIQMERFDYFVASAIKRGFVLAFDFYASRKVRYEDVGIAGKSGLIPHNDFKGLVIFHDGAFDNWKKFVREFLMHVNPYTGRDYASEPAMAFASLVNEGNLVTSWGTLREYSFVRDRYAEWVKERRSKQSDWMKASIEDDPRKTSLYARKSAAVAEFFAECEAKRANEMKSFVRGLGCKALVSGVSNGPHTSAMHRTRIEVYDYSDVHFYFDHPEKDGKTGMPPARFTGKDVISLGDGLIGCGFSRMIEQPFVMTEWDAPSPAPYRGGASLLFGALSAAQGWDGAWRFAYSHNIAKLRPREHSAMHFFDTVSDPVARMTEYLTVCLYLRGDLKENPGLLILCDPSDEVKSRTARYFGDSGVVWARDVAWKTRIASAADRDSRAASKALVLGRGEEGARKEAPYLVDGTPCVCEDRATGTISVATPRTCAGFTEAGGCFRAGALESKVEGARAVVWASALDGADSLTTSQRLLIGHVTDMQWKGARFADVSQTRYQGINGKERTMLARAGRAIVRLNVRGADGYRLWALDLSGHRRACVPMRAEGDELVFSLDVRQPFGGCFIYELVKID